MARARSHLPNLLTSIALLCAFAALIAANDHRYALASAAVLLAIVFDGLDGRVARLTGTQSAFGGEYDSLCDMCAFGMAPWLGSVASVAACVVALGYVSGIRIALPSVLCGLVWIYVVAGLVFHGVTVIRQHAVAHDAPTDIRFSTRRSKRR
jgi:phosphatidylserine synthase